MILLSISVLFITGCSVSRLDSNDLLKNVDNLLSVKVSMYNEFYEGYKYYLPKTLKFIDKDEYNAILQDRNNNRYYLYIDAISYYHKIKNDYEEKDGSYISKRLDYRKKTGYLQIDEVDYFFIYLIIIIKFIYSSNLPTISSIKNIY